MYRIGSMKSPSRNKYQNQSTMIKSSKSHLNSVNESYFEHQGVAFRYAINCLMAAGMAIVHGLIPAWFETGASDLVKKMAGNRKVESS